MKQMLMVLFRVRSFIVISELRERSVMLALMTKNLVTAPINALKVFYLCQSSFTAPIIYRLRTTTNLQET